MVAHDMVLPEDVLPLSRINNAPAMLIRDLLAALRDNLTGIRSSILNPAFRQSRKDQRQDCAQESSLVSMAHEATLGQFSENDR